MIDSLTILERAASLFGVTIAEIVSASRRTRIMPARQACMYTLHQLGYSYQEIGDLLGGRDHTTIIYGARQAMRRAAVDMHYAAKIALLLREDEPPSPPRVRPLTPQLRLYLAFGGDVDAWPATA